MNERESYCILVKPYECSFSCSQDTLVKDNSGDEISLLERSETNQTQKELVGNLRLDISDVVKLVTGVLTVNEYQSREIADNSHDEKKIRSAENHSLWQQIEYGALRHQTEYAFSSIWHLQDPPPPSAAATGSAAQLSFVFSATTFQPFIYQQQPFCGISTRRKPQPSNVSFNCFSTGHCKTNCPQNKSLSHWEV